MWKTIEEYPNYVVSSDGYVMNTITELILKGNINRGYYRVCLCNQYGKLNKIIHRLVAKAFIPTDNIELEINHIDGSKLNNHYKNLEWVTRKENMDHAIGTGLMDNTKIIYQYSLEGFFIKEWKSLKQAGQELGIQQTHISAVALGKKNRKQTGGFRWAFKDRLVPVLCR